MTSKMKNILLLKNGYFSSRSLRAQTRKGGREIRMVFGARAVYNAVNVGFTL
jgi:hypothetical protein